MPPIKLTPKQKLIKALRHNLVIGKFENNLNAKQMAVAMKVRSQSTYRSRMKDPSSLTVAELYDLSQKLHIPFLDMFKERKPADE